MASSDIHQQQTNMDKQTQIQGVVDNVVIKIEKADECMLVVGEQALLKQQTLDRDCLETCRNVYDSYFEVLKHELCDNNSDIKTFTDNQQESPRAAVSLPTDCAPTFEEPLAMMRMDETSSMGEICFESKTQQSLQKAKDTDNSGLGCGVVKSGATRTRNKIYTCEHCVYKNVNRRYFVDHVRTHTGEKPFTCKHCDFKCSRPTYLKVHLKTHTKEKTFTCKHCDYKCSRSTYLKSHLRTHTGKKPFTCKHCDFKCSRSTYLKVHLRTHTGEKPYCCKHCDLKFSQSSALKVHMRTHTGEKPYCCKHCDLKFSQSSTLKVHMRTHSGEKPYCCKHCNLKFSQSFNLKLHMRIHTREKP